MAKQTAVVNKHVLKSKTFWLGIVAAVTPLLPGVGEFVSANTEAVGMVWGVLAIIFRSVTKGGVVLKE